MAYVIGLELDQGTRDLEGPVPVAGFRVDLPAQGQDVRMGL